MKKSQNKRNADSGIIQEEKYKSEFTSEDAALDYLASILIEGYLEIQHNESQSEYNQTSDHILPSVNEGASWRRQQFSHSRKSL